MIIERLTSYFWNERFMLTFDGLNSKGNFHAFKLFDLVNPGTKLFYVQKDGDEFHSFYPLDDQQALLIERSHPNYFISLVQVNLNDQMLYKLNTMVRSYNFSFFTAMVDNKSKKFALQFPGMAAGASLSLQICKISNNKIEMEEAIQANVAPFNFYAGNFLFNVYITNAEDFRDLSLYVYNLERRRGNLLNLKELPNHVCNYAPSRSELAYEWNDNRLFVAIKFKASDNYGIAWIDYRTRKWTVLAFAIPYPIQQLKCVAGEHLMVYVKVNDQQTGNFYDQKVYKVSLRKPDLLRTMAWAATIKLYKNSKKVEPYVKAHDFLPYTSDLRSFFGLSDCTSP